MNPQEVLELLQKTEQFKNWRKEHPESFLSHFFSPLSKEFKQKSNWDLGFYDSKDEKITIFSHQGESNFLIKPEEEVFKKEESKVAALEMSKIKFSYEKAIDLLKEKLTSFFPQQQIGDGFIILQNFTGKILWNFTFMSNTLQFLNVKIDAESGEVSSHQAVNVIQKDQSVTPT